MSDVILPDQSIEFGAEELASDVQIIQSILMLCLNDNGTIKSGGTHHIAVLLEKIDAVIPKITGSKAAAYQTNTTTEYALVKFGELLRREKKASNWLYTLKNWDTFFAVGAGDATAIRDALKWMPEVADGPLLEFFGKWNRDQHGNQDDAIAAMFTIVMYCVFFFNLHVGCYANVLYQNATWEKNVGEAVQFGKYDQKSWMTFLFQENNSLTEDILGFASSYVDDDTLRTLEFPWVDNATQVLQRLFTESEWIWRRGRFVRVRPMFSMYNPDSAVSGEVADLQKFNDANFSYAPFLKKTSVDWTWMIHILSDIIGAIQSKYFQNAVFGKLKKKFTMQKLYDIGRMVKLAQGSGGLLFHQTTYGQEDIASADDIHYKFFDEAVDAAPPDTTDYPLNVYVARRKSGRNADKRVIILGDVPEDDFRLLLAMNTYSYAEEVGVAISNVHTNGSRMKPKLWFGFGINKVEDEAYNVKWPVTVLEFLTDSAAAKGAADGKPVGLAQWTVNAAEGDQNFPTSTKFSKVNYYPLKQQDPYKKLKFTALSKNKFDVDKVRATFLKAVFGVVPASDFSGDDESNATSEGGDNLTLDLGVKDKAPVVVSATAKDDAHEKKEAHKKKMEEQKKAKEKKEEKKKVVTSAMPEDLSPGDAFEKKLDEESSTDQDT